MFLNLLNTTQKELFLEFAYCLASVDGDYSASERSMMEKYCSEMQLPVKTDGFTKGMEKIIEILDNECNHAKKKIILFEAVGLALVDGKYSDDERDMIIAVQKKFGIDEEYTYQCEKVLNEYIQFQSKINSLVLE